MKYIKQHSGTSTIVTPKFRAFTCNLHRAFELLTISSMAEQQDGRNALHFLDSEMQFPRVGRLGEVQFLGSLLPSKQAEHSLCEAKP